MTRSEAIAKAERAAALMAGTYVVLGPCPRDGYWIASTRTHQDLWADRKPVYTATAVRLASDEGIMVLTLAEFFKANDGFDETEIAEIEATLNKGQTYTGGGGASPIWTLAKV